MKFIELKKSSQYLISSKKKLRKFTLMFAGCFKVQIIQSKFIQKCMKIHVLTKLDCVDMQIYCTILLILHCVKCKLVEKHQRKSSAPRQTHIKNENLYEFQFELESIINRKFLVFAFTRILIKSIKFNWNSHDCFKSRWVDSALCFMQKS